MTERGKISPESSTRTMTCGPMDEVASAEPVALDLAYSLLPHPWTDEELEAAVAAQRAERGRRVARVAKATRRKKDEKGNV